MKSLRFGLLAGACALSLMGCASPGPDLQTAAGDVANVTAQAVKAAPDAVTDAAGIGAAVVTVLGDLATLLTLPLSIQF